MPCPNCNNPYAIIWMGDIYKKHICTKCYTRYHENNELERLKLVMDNCKEKLRSEKINE